MRSSSAAWGVLGLALLVACDDAASSAEDMAIDLDAAVDGAVDAAPRLDMAPTVDMAPMVDAAPDAMPDATPDAVPDALPADMGPPPADGEALYTLHCAFCHGADGEGYVSDNANALAHPDFLSLVTDEFLAAAIEYGRPGTPMPGLGQSQQGPLDSADIDALVAYMRRWQVEPARDVSGIEVDGLEQRGRPIYDALCTGCHGPMGENGEYMSVANPWFLETISDGFIRTVIAEGRAGTPMPAYGDRLTAQQLDDLTTLIRSWARPVDGSPVPMFEPDVEGGTLNPDGDDPVFALRDDRFVSMVDVNAAVEAGQRLFLLDARSRADHFRERITGSVSLPHFALDAYLDRLPRDVWIVTYCGCPHAISGQAFDILRAAGFERVAVLDEGFYEWRDAGFPVSSGEP